MGLRGDTGAAAESSYSISPTEFALLALIGFTFGTIFAATACAMYFISGSLLRPRPGMGKAVERLIVLARLIVAVALLFVMALYGPALRFDPSNVVVGTATLTIALAIPGLLIIRSLFLIQITYDDVMRDTYGDT